MAWGKAKVAPGWRVVVTDGPDVGWHHHVGAEPIQVGRAEASDIVLTETQVSREHLWVYWHQGAVKCEDLNSTHGSYYLPRWRRWLRLRPKRVGVCMNAQDRPQRWHPRAHVLIGPHTLSLVPDWRVPTGKKERIPAEMLLRFALPLVMGAALIPLYARAGNGRIIIAVLFPLMMVLMALVTWRSWRKRKKRQREPEVVESEQIRPARLDSLCRRNPPPVSRAWETGNALAQMREFPPIPPGASLALVGQDALSFARWLIAQWAVFSPLDYWEFLGRLGSYEPETWLTFLPHHGEQKVFLLDSLAARLSPPPTQSTCLVVCETMEEVPHWVTQVVQIRTGHNRQISARFGLELSRQLAHRNQSLALPTQVPFTIESAPRTGQAGLAIDSLAVDVGVGASGPAMLDLVADGPHALVAGMTGSGKSEFLTTWLLGMCSRYSPSAVGLVLIDYKGGATFASLEKLPHSLGVVTDLSASLTARVLASLHAELRRRETELAASGARSIDEAPQLGRLVIVVDEFRIMATEHPEFLDSLVRLAAQGRSLGMHLILATQRPGGIVQADVQANISLRICFQVRDTADSLDVLGNQTAAQLPTIPGRGMIAAEEISVFQSAYVGEHVSVIVESLAIRWHGHQQLLRPWAEPLPQVLSWQELLRTHPSLPGSGEAGILTGVIDDPHHQRVVPWFVAHQSALVVQGSIGFSNTCRMIAHSGLAQGLRVAVITHDDGWPLAQHFHTLIDPQHPELVCYFVDEFLGGRLPQPPQLLIIDDADIFITQADQIYPGHGLSVLRTLFEARRRLGFTLVVATRNHGDRLAQWADSRFIATPADTTSAQLAGVERTLAVGPFVPGRGILMSQSTQFIAHVAYLPKDTPEVELKHVEQKQIFTEPPAVVISPVVGTGKDESLRSNPPAKLPRVRDHIILGQGIHGPDQPIIMHLSHTIVVIGTRGSGRTTALNVISDQLQAAGYRIWNSDREATEAREANEAQKDREIQEAQKAHEDGERHCSGFLILDNLTNQSIREIQIPDDVPVIAAVGSEILNHPFPGFATRLAHSRTFLILGNPANIQTISHEPVGPYLPIRSLPGRGILVQHQKISPVQVYCAH